MIHTDFSCLTQEHHAADEDKDQPNNRASGALTPTEEISSHPHPHPQPQPPSFSSHFPSKAPPAIRPGCSHPPFPFPMPRFHPSIPPVPPRLPNGTIPIPPPGWIPPPGIPIPPPRIPPPPSIPPPPTFLGRPPPLIVPPGVPPPVYPSPMQPAGPSDKGYPPRQCTAPLPFPQPPWPAPPFPRFNPFVPPPGYPLLRENPHKLTVEKVLEVIVDELKSIIKKDITRRMIEGVAFKSFEEWWDCQEKKTKVIPLHSLLFHRKSPTMALEPVGSLLFLFFFPQVPSSSCEKWTYKCGREDQTNKSPHLHQRSGQKASTAVFQGK